MSRLPRPLPLDAATPLVAYHIARTPQDIPTQRGITYVWAGNGLFKHGWNGTTRVLLPVVSQETPGLGVVQPFISWRAWRDPLPATLLGEALADALAHYRADAPQERQWFIVLRDGMPVLQTPIQRGGSAHLHYEQPHDPVLCDIHSHHAMRPFFSSTDDTDDAWLGLSVVLGRIGSPWPTAVARLNCYGAHYAIPLGHTFAGQAHAEGVTLRDEADVARQQLAWGKEPVAPEEACDAAVIPT
ncbi:MAG: hypothetical protein EI684_19300 [Candidatus Viridilinea halotolerans]|uniref:JAB domain-containing protein n=1 Tax=Candidatus Viridilinea halotolerans TaxID=2491704 RepID=A0A426TSV6_9CHLR|nr:MAG: hypothetical protein EI684_19300 [Candidatus Viridilinea halotolerans]